MEPSAKTPDPAGLDRRAKAAIAACVVLPVLIGIVVTAGTFRPQPAPPPPMVGHWVYVQSLGAAVHVDGGNKKVDASVPVGSASADSLVVQDQHTNYLVDTDKTIEFTRTGVTDDKPSVGVGEAPVPMQAGGRGYLVYRAAGMIVPLGSQQPITAGVKLGAPVMTPAGELWVNRPDTGEVCVVETTLQCKVKIPAQGALTLLDGKPVFVDTDTSTVHPLTTKDRPTKLGVRLPGNALIGGSSVDGRIPVIDPVGNRLLLVAVGGDVMRVPLAPGKYERPCTAGDAVAVVDENTGTVTSYDATGNRRATHILSGNARATQGDDGRVYVDSADGLKSVVMDPNGTLTPVPTSDQIPPVYKEAPSTTTPPPPSPTITPTTTETIPATPDTVTLTPTAPPGGTSGGTGGTGSSAAGSTTKPKGPTSTKPLPGAPGPTVDVLSATPLGDGKARVRVSVRGGGSAFCHVFFNSVERAAAKCTGQTDITATGIPAHQLYDVHVLGVNDKGTGNPGRRVQVAL
ncbi:hypothetical protein [Labedaea rhizosphaerae]|uniref:hypothetical protein n=1 Tax=Labedaea rhizosphaerae TaxID=598644 RepID=UPI001061735E|nr:hypothetical protein [Labedaea rhizosphaerae]